MKSVKKENMERYSQRCDIELKLSVRFTFTSCSNGLVCLERFSPLVVLNRKLAWKSKIRGEVVFRIPWRKFKLGKSLLYMEIDL